MNWKTGLALAVTKRHWKADRSRRMMEVAGEPLAVRQESDRLGGDRFDTGVITQPDRREASASVAKAEADQLTAELGNRLALAELEKTL